MQSIKMQAQTPADYSQCGIDQAIEVQEYFNLSIGKDKWFKFNINDKLFKEFINFTLYGSSDQLSDQQNQVANKLKEKLLSIPRSGKEILINVIYVCSVQENDENALYPMYLVKINSDDSVNERGRFVYVDTNLNQFDSWDEVLMHNTFPSGTLVMPDSGIYHGKEQIELKIRYIPESKNSKTESFFGKICDDILKYEPIIIKAVSSSPGFALAVSFFLSVLKLMRKYQSGDLKVSDCIKEILLTASETGEKALSVLKLNETVKKFVGAALGLINSLWNAKNLFIIQKDLIFGIAKKCFDNDFIYYPVLKAVSFVKECYQSCVNFFKKWIFPRQTQLRITYNPHQYENDANDSNFIPFHEVLQMARARILPSENTRNNNFVPFDEVLKSCKLRVTNV